MMENTILFEDMEYSVTSAPYDYNNSFIDNFKEQYNFDIDQLIIDGRIIKVEEKPINEKRGWHYFGKNKFEVIKTELNEFYKIIDPERLRLNPHLIDQIRFDTEGKKADIENLQNDYLNKEINTKTFAKDHWEYSDVESWLYVINKIVEQPLYIIEAIEKYPESIEENQRIYFRHDYIKSRISFASDKHIIRTFDFKRLIYSKLAKEINIKSLFYFFEQLIEVLGIHSDIDYIKTQLFQLLFDEFYVFYERGVTEFNLHPFKNIETVKKQLNELKPQQIEIPDQETTAKIESPLSSPELFDSINRAVIDSFPPDRFTIIFDDPKVRSIFEICQSGIDCDYKTFREGIETANFEKWNIKRQNFIQDLTYRFSSTMGAEWYTKICWRMRWEKSTVSGQAGKLETIKELDRILPRPTKRKSMK